MLKSFFLFVLFCLIQLVTYTSVFAINEYSVKNFLDNREESWPDWYLPNLKFSNIKKDLIYPSWFEGNWIVYSEDVTHTSAVPISYEVNFFKNKKGEIIADRAKNTQAIGNAIFQNESVQVKTDPESF